MTDYKRFGYKGEDLAADFLRRKGYDIVAVNYTTSFGEIDIVARYKGTTVFVEVKSRRSERFGVPAEAVHYRKRKKLLRRRNAGFNSIRRTTVLAALMSSKS